jgi:hypothetical protein
MRITSLFAILLISATAFTQEKLGLQTGNYAGVNSLSLNPAGNLYNPLKWDFNLVGAGIFFDNNYSFVRKTSILDLMKAGGNASFELSENVEGPLPPNGYAVDFFELNNSRYAWASAFIKGPSLVYKINEIHSVGFFTGIRAVAGSQEIPNNLSYNKYQSRLNNQPFQVHPASAALLTWMEIGLNYALKIPSEGGDFGLGASLRWLNGYEGGFANFEEEFQINKTSGTSLRVREMRGTYGFTTSNLKSTGIRPGRNGGGMGVDLGFVKLFGTDESDYKIRIGASIIDLGFISFNKNAQSHKLVVDSLVTLYSRDYENYTGIEEFVSMTKTFSKQTMGDSLATRVGDQFTLALPAAISLQADYKVVNNVFVNALLVQRLRFAKNKAERTNLFALTPRFETRWLEAQVPVVLLNYDQLNLGLALRLGFLSVGTDNVLSFFGKRNFSGSDIYFALKVNPFNIGIGGGGSGRSGRGGVKCYDF